MKHPTSYDSGDITWRSIRVLLFSLDDSFRFLVRQTFRKLSVRDVLSTSVSADATPMMKQGPDIALIDFDGDVAAALAFLERVRLDSDTIPVLVVARSGEKAGQDEALVLGIEGIVPKVVSGHELSHRVADTLRNAKRLSPPAAKPKPAMAMPAKPATPLTVTPEAGAAAEGGAKMAGGPKVAAETAALKNELSALTARLGQSLGGKAATGTPASGAPPANGATYGGAETGRPKGGAGDWGSGDWGNSGPAPAKAGKAGGDDWAPVEAAKPKGANKLAAEDVVSPPPASPPSGGKLEALADAAPAALKLAAKDAAARRKDEEAKARWQAELAQTGHESRTGSDVAGLDVTAIVAAHLAWLTSKGAAGKRATFQGMDLAGGDLSRAVLANATFREAELSDASLAGSRLDGADFRYAKLGATDLTGANLGVAQLRHADLRLANLEGASLRGADLSGARLGGAKLAGADFGGVVLVGTDLREADLAEVDSLTQAQIDKAICDMTTKLPPGVFRPRAKEDA